MKELNDKMKERLKKWLDTLNEEERCQAELLDAYFTFRSNLPDEDPGFGKAVEDPKSTDEIIDELTPMMYVSRPVVAAWMRAHDYHFTTIADGTVKWAIWRFVVDNPQMT